MKPIMPLAALGSVKAGGSHGLQASAVPASSPQTSLGHLPFAKSPEQSGAAALAIPLVILIAAGALFVWVRQLSIRGHGHLTPLAKRLYGWAQGRPMIVGDSGEFREEQKEWRLVQRQHLAHGSQVIEGRWRGHPILLAVDRLGQVQVLANTENMALHEEASHASPTSPKAQAEPRTRAHSHRRKVSPRHD